MCGVGIIEAHIIAATDEYVNMPHTLIRMTGECLWCVVCGVCGVVWCVVCVVCGMWCEVCGV